MMKKLALWPKKIGFVAEQDDIWALAYLLFAGISLHICIKSWWLNYRLGIVLFIIDLIFYASVMYSIEPMHSNYNSISFLLLTFLIVFATERWSWRQGVQVAIALNILCAVMLAQMWAEGMEMSLAQAVRRQALQLVVSFFVATTSGLSRLVQLSTAELSIGADRKLMFQRAVEFATAESKSPAGALCWVGNNDSKCDAAHIGLHGSATQYCHCPGDFVTKVDGPAMFDRDGRRAVGLLADGRVAIVELGSGEREFIARFGLDRGVFIPLEGISGNGRLVYALPARTGVSHLRFALAIGSRISAAFDRHASQLVAEERGAIQLRLTVARDLHDSVAQTLAGTSYWLQSLRRNLAGSQTASEEIGQMITLLGSEQQQIRRMIADLREGKLDNPMGNLAGQLEPLLQNLSQQWKVEARLVCDDGLDQVPQMTIFGVLKIVREAISNAVRHGQAGTITVSVGRDGDWLVLAIEDDGKGFADDHELPHTLNERIAFMGGTLDVTRKRSPSRLWISLPLNRGVSG